MVSNSTPRHRRRFNLGNEFGFKFSPRGTNPHVPPLHCLPPPLGCFCIPSSFSSASLALLLSFYRTPCPALPCPLVLHFFSLLLVSVSPYVRILSLSVYTSPLFALLFDPPLSARTHTVSVSPPFCSAHFILPTSSKVSPVSSLFSSPSPPSPSSYTLFVLCFCLELVILVAT